MNFNTRNINKLTKNSHLSALGFEPMYQMPVIYMSARLSHRHSHIYFINIFFILYKNNSLELHNTELNFFINLLVPSGNNWPININDLLRGLLIVKNTKQEVLYHFNFNTGNFRVLFLYSNVIKIQRK